jgi:O-antigen/teichoic acid export membrane protein
MVEIRKLFKHSAQYLSGRVLVMLLGFISFPLFTRLFSVADYGTINLIVKIVVTVAILSKLGIQHSIVRFYGSYSGPDAIRRFCSTVVWGGVLGAALVALSSGIVLATLPMGSTKAAIRGVSITAMLLVFTGGLRPIMSNVLRAQEKTKFYNVLEVINKIIGIVVVCGLVFLLGATPQAYLGGTLVGESIAVGMVIWYLMRNGFFSPKVFDCKIFLTALRFGAPLIAYEVAGMVLDSGDRVVVNAYLGPTQLGYYSAAYNVSTYIQELLATPLNLALFPLCVDLWHKSGGYERTQTFLNTAFRYYLAASIGLLAIVSVTARDSMVVLASPKFLESYRLIPLLVAGMIVFATTFFFNMGLALFNKTVHMAVLTIAGAALNIGLNIVLLPIMGIQGAALATFLSFLAMAIATAVASFRYLPLKVFSGNLLRYLLAGSIAVILVRPLSFRYVIIELTIRGTAALAIYVAFLYLTDSEIRGAAQRLVGSIRQAVSVAGNPEVPAGIPCVAHATPTEGDRCASAMAGEK